MKKLLVIILIIIFFFSASPVFAAPIISEVLGSVANGSMITINGSGFGTRPDYDTSNPNKLNFGWIDFESASSFLDGSNCGDGFIPNCADSDCHRDWFIATAENRANSTKWARRVDLHDTFACNIHGLKKPGDSGAAYPNFAFVSFWFKIPRTASSGKFYRQWTDSGAGTDVVWSGVGGPDGYMTRTFGYNSGGTVLGDATWQRIDFVQTSSSHLDVYILG